METNIRKLKVIARLKQVDAVAANTEWTREQLAAEGMEYARIQVITGGLDTTLFRPPTDRADVRQRAGLANNHPILLTAANLVPDKNIDTTLRAIAELAADWPSLHYVIVGEGPCKPALRSLAVSLGIGERVIFAGGKTQEELCRYYQAAEVYVQPSRVESMGRTYMEAGACGIPVVAARIGGVPSVVTHGENGFLVDDPLDVDAVAAAIDQLLASTELRQRMGREGAEMARSKFSWEAVSMAFENLMIGAVSSRA